MNASVPIIRANGEGDKQSFLGGGLHTWKLMAEDTDGAFFLFEDALTRGKTTPLHRHPDSDETVYVLEGEIVVNVDGNEHRIGTGGMSFVPRGVAHAFLVISDRARLLTLKTPGIGQESTAAPVSRRPTTPPTRWTSHVSKRQQKTTAA